jgi:hypothetical protein
VVEEGDRGEQTLRRGVEPAFWLIEKIEDGPMEMLTVDLEGGQEALSIFSHQEEAEMFLWLGRLTDSWRARKSEGTEIARVLSAPRAGIGFVVLDPLPQVFAEHRVDLVSLTREHFTLRLMRMSRGTSEPMTDGGYKASLP